MQFGKIYQLVKQKQLDAQNYKNKGHKDYVQLAEEKMQNSLKVIKSISKETPNENNGANKTISNVFSFLDNISLTSNYNEEQENVMEMLKPNMTDNENNHKEIEEDLSAYNFRKFAATYFKHPNYQYSRKPMKDSLLELPTPDDVIAAQALFVTILRFMGDLDEPKSDVSAKTKEAVMLKVRETLGRGFVNRKEYQAILEHEQKVAMMSKVDKRKLISMTLKKKTKLLEDVRQGFVEDNFTIDYYKNWINHRKTSNLEKIHFVIAHGILRRELRDEIFCQICKQLISNPSNSSHARGWILLALCIGCFPPSDKFINYLRAFMKTGPPRYAPYCFEKLNRTFKNGARTEPPSWLELMASKNKQPIQIQVTLMDNNSLNFTIDSATVAKELCTDITSQIHLNDTFGFSLFITINGTVMSLGNDLDHIMDAVSQCEQYAKELGVPEKNADWKLYFRKEIFTPWHKPSDDSVATNLIYHQIIRGLKSGEYKCQLESDLATLIATQCFIDSGDQINQNILQKRIGEYLPTHITKIIGTNVDKWVNLTIDAFNKLTCVKKKQNAIKAKEMVVKFAKITWPILFSKYYEAIQVSGPELLKKNMVIAVNWTGICMIDAEEQILLELLFSEILSIRFEPVKNSLLQRLYLSTIYKDDYIFTSPEAENMVKLIQEIIDGLKHRSVHLVALQDYKHPTNADSFISFRKGDLITLINGLKGNDILTSSWGYGECNNTSGDFPTEHVYIIPTLSSPQPRILKAFKKENVIPERRLETFVPNTEQRLKLYTLASYAENNFRLKSNSIISRPSVIVTARRASKEELWKYTKEPIHRPLLKKLLNNDELSQKACLVFRSILIYMEDLPAAKAKYPNEYTDHIFRDAMKNDLLKDEIYCQMMKQLTYNHLLRSEEKGWELMYLITGLFVPSTSLLTELKKFLKSRANPFVEPCLQKLQKCQKVGPRKFSSDVIEVEAIQSKSLQIYHKIYFPDDTDEAFEIDSLTRASDLCKEISDRLNLKNSNGFSLIIHILDKVFSIPNNDFFFDFLQEIFQWVKQNNPNWNEQTKVEYRVLFMKKLWVDSYVGVDPVADEVFYYPQEVAKYLMGYHKCSKTEVNKLAALILRVKVYNLDLKISKINKMIKNLLNELIPTDLLEQNTSKEWIESILKAYNKNLNIYEAKLQFLQEISQYPTFGSAFFVVKQNKTKYPPKVILAVNKRGINIIDPETKDILEVFKYAELTNWSSGNSIFSLNAGNFMKETKLLFETPQGYKIDDLVSSYIDYIKKSAITKQNQDLI